MDPSYDGDVRRSPLEFTGEFEARPGDWVAVAEISPGYDGRVARLLAYHIDSLDEPGLRDWVIAPFQAGVDTGLLGIFAAGAVPDRVGSYNTPNGFYARMLGLLPRDPDHPETIYAVPGGIGAICTTGFGDGVYQVHWRRDAQGRIASVQVGFLTPEHIARHDGYCRANGIERLPPGGVLDMIVGPRMLALAAAAAQGGDPHGRGAGLHGRGGNAARGRGAGPHGRGGNAARGRGAPPGDAARRGRRDRGI